MSLRSGCDRWRFTVSGGVGFPYSAPLHTGYGFDFWYLDGDGMVGYRRNRGAGGTYFFTVTLRNRSSDVLVIYVDVLRDAFRSVRAERPFTVDAIVVLPDHLHTVWTLPEGDADYSGRWRAIKSRFTRQLRGAGIALSRDDRGEYRLWQRRFWEHTIRDDPDFERHVDYIHWNPVKHRLVSTPVHWPHSSLHRYVRLGLLSPSWSGGVDEIDDLYAE